MRRPAHEETFERWPHTHRLRQWRQQVAYNLNSICNGGRATPPSIRARGDTKGVKFTALGMTTQNSGELPFDTAFISLVVVFATDFFNAARQESTHVMNEWCTDLAFGKGAAGGVIYAQAELRASNAD